MNTFHRHAWTVRSATEPFSSDCCVNTAAALAVAVMRFKYWGPTTIKSPGMKTEQVKTKKSKILRPNHHCQNPKLLFGPYGSTPLTALELTSCFSVLCSWWYNFLLLCRCGHYIFVLFLSFFPRLISAVADWMSTILLHMVWP